MTVVQAIAAAAHAAGTRVAFGMPGGDTLPLIDALDEVGIRFVLVRDEASAGFAADASAQLTGAPGLCCATLGPGLMNLLGGVAGAFLDRAPVLAITSSYRADRRASYTHMMLDQGALVAATGKAHFTLSAGHAHAEVARALAVATSPRPGPVWLQIPTDVAEGDAGPPVRWPRSDPSPVAVDPARLAELRRPVILVGFGGRHAPIDAFAESLRAPVITTYKAKGAIPEGRGWSAGAASLSPVVDALHQRLLAEADGIVLIGWDPVEVRDHWMPGWPQHTAVFVLDDHVPTDIPCRMDALWVGPLRALVGGVAPGAGRSGWSLADVARHRAAVDAVFEEETFGPATVIRAVQAATPGDVVVTLDVGAHRITASNVWLCDRPDALLQSNGLASMGYGLPAAVAAAAHGRRALCVTGDAGLQLVAGELGTAVEVGGTLVVVVLVDDTLSLIGLKQQRAGRQARGVSFRNPDWAALARSFGARGVMTSSSDAVRAAVTQAFSDGGVTVIAAHFDATPYVRQM